MLASPGRCKVLMLVMCVSEPWPPPVVAETVILCTVMLGVRLEIENIKSVVEWVCLVPFTEYWML